MKLFRRHVPVREPLPSRPPAIPADTRALAEAIAVLEEALARAETVFGAR